MPQNDEMLDENPDAGTVCTYNGVDYSPGSTSYQSGSCTVARTTGRG